MAYQYKVIFDSEISHKDVPATIIWAFRRAGGRVEEISPDFHYNWSHPIEPHRSLIDFALRHKGVSIAQLHGDLPR